MSPGPWAVVTIGSVGEYLGSVQGAESCQLVAEPRVRPGLTASKPCLEAGRRVWRDEAVRAVNELHRQLPVMQDSHTQAHVCEVVRLKDAILSPLRQGHRNVVIPPAAVLVIE